MDASTQVRYQPGGDIYATLLNQYGKTAADQIAAAAASGSDASVQSAIESARTQAGNVVAAQDSSYVDALLNQLKNPLAAPLEDANSLIGNSVVSFLKQPWVIFAVVVIIFTAAGGWAWLGKKVFKD